MFESFVFSMYLCALDEEEGVGVLKYHYSTDET